MPLTPETLTRHELNGLGVRVADAANPDLVGIAGRVVSETMRTLSVRGSDADGSPRVWQVPKAGATLEFRIPTERTDEAAGRGRATPDAEPGSTSTPTSTRTRREAPGSASERPWDTAGPSAGQSGGREGAAYVTVDGTTLLSRPALRTEHAGDSKWR
jgi:ribonuclease P protein subunit POP4